jgi:beta-lactamase regulating signal transducer with metallopeptidase domain
MNNPLFPEPLVWDLLWQTTLWLLLGMVVSFLWARRPARAHRLLLLTLVAALVTPLLSQTVRLRGWGLIVRPAPLRAPVLPEFEALPLPTGARLDRTIPLDLLKKELAVLARETAVAPAVPLAPPEVAAAGETQAEAVAAFDVARLLLLGWAMGAGALALRLLLALARCWRLLACAHRVHDASLRQAACKAVARLGLRIVPLLYTADRVRSPMIWCWGRRPVLLLPADAAERAEVDWVAVFCHELAHWRRRDHRAGLLAELGVAVLCWHPLAWWAKRRLGLLCEQACDDWVLASGAAPVTYAESLLNLLPQRRPVLAQAAVSSRSGLMRRLAHILAADRKNPLVGRSWAVLSTAMVWVLVAALGLAQTRTVTADEPPAPPLAVPAPVPQQPEPAAPAPKAAGKQVITGRVLGPDGKGIADACLALVLWPRQQMPIEPMVLGEVQGDDAGKFCLEVELPGLAAWVQKILVTDSKSPALPPIGSMTLLAAAKGFGLAAVPWPSDKAILEIRLAPEQVVRGRLIDLQGQPAAGVTLSVSRLGSATSGTQNANAVVLLADQIEGDNDEDEQPRRINVNAMTNGSLMVMDKSVSMWASNGGWQVAGIDVKPLAFRNPPAGRTPWPPSVTTDARGCFTLHGIPAGKGVVLQVRDERFALQTLILPAPEKGKDVEVTRVLAPPRFLEGTVTDATSGKPVPRALLQVNPQGGHGSVRFFLDRAVVWGGADWRGRHGRGDLLSEYYVALFSDVVGQDSSDLPPLEARADDQGRFRLSLFAAGSYTLRVLGPAGESYLRRTTTVSWPREAVVRHTVSIALTRGIPVRGKVTEAGSGKAVTGARVDFWAKGLQLPAGVRQPQHVKTGADGTFRALLPPASWHLLVNAEQPEYLYQKIAVAKVVEPNPTGAKAPPTEPCFRPDGWLALDLKPRAGPQQVGISLRRAPLLRGRLVGPDGKAVGKARMLRVVQPLLHQEQRSGEFIRRLSLDLTGTIDANTLWVANQTGAGPQPALDLPDGKFAVPAPDLEESYQFYFIDAAGKLGGMARFQGKQAEGEPLTVRLASCGSAQMRVLDATGKPQADYRPQVQLLLGQQPASSSTARQRQLIDLWIESAWEHGRAPAATAVALKDLITVYEGDNFRTDAEGRITFAALIPGATYRILNVAGGVRDFRVEAGQVVELGDVRLLPPKEAPKTQPTPPAK